MNQIPENRNLLTMWGADKTYEPEVIDPPVIERNYFSIPGMVKTPVAAPYTREPGKMVHPQFKPEFIKQIALAVWQISEKELRNKSRKLDFIDHRCILVWLCYKYAYSTGMKKISEMINRDRTTAIHLVLRANNLIATGEAGFIEKLQKLEAILLKQ